MDTTIECKTRFIQTDKVQGFMGYVVCWENGKRLWSQATGIYRYTWQDALLDAEHMQRELLAA